MMYLLVRFGLWLARLGGWQETVCKRAHLPDDNPELVDDVRLCTEHVQLKFPNAPGEFKRREALRMLLNRHPALTERELNFTIELVLVK